MIHYIHVQMVHFNQLCCTKCCALQCHSPAHCKTPPPKG